MSKAKMPETVAVVVEGYALFWAGSGPVTSLCERTGAKVGSQLITTEQAEAYAQARVNEVLDKAVEMATNLHPDTAPHWVAAAINMLKKEQP